MVPVASLQPQGDRVLVYDPKETEVNAVKAVHLHNTSDMVLANGSISILEGGRFMAQADFMPMLPGDEQLVPYDQDTSVSITRSYPQDLQSSMVQHVEAICDKRKRVIGGSLVHKKVKTTRYTLQNNSTERTVPKFYIDHSADSAHGGFVITTTGRVVKAVTGFSRLECALPPLEETVIDVTEEVEYRQRLTSCSAIRSFLEGHLTTELMQNGVLSEELLAQLQACVEREELCALYQKLERMGSGGQVTDAEFSQWKQRALLPAEMLQLVEEVSRAEARVRELARQEQTHQAHVQKVFANQERLRSNIKSMEKVQSTHLVERYLQDLNAQEDDLIATNTLIDQLVEDKTEAEGEVKQFRLKTAAEAAKLRESSM